MKAITDTLVEPWLNCPVCDAQLLVDATYEATTASDGYVSVSWTHWNVRQHDCPGGRRVLSARRSGV